MNDNLIKPENNKDSNQRSNTVFSIKHSNYLVPYKSDGIGQGCHTNFAALVSPAGEKFIPAFTGADEFYRWPYTHDKAVLLSYENLKDFVVNNQYNLSGFIIDPLSKMLIIRENQMDQINLTTAGTCFHDVRHSKDIRLTKPDQELTALIESLKRFFSGCENVYTAYTLMLKEPDEAKAHLLVVVDFDGDKGDLFPSLASVLCANLDEGETFEMVKVTYDLLRLLMPIADPFYKKSC